LTAENEKLRRQNVRLQEELRKAGIIIEIQKNVRARLIRTPAGPETPIQVS
jgi:acetyl esterase/lipase